MTNDQMALNYYKAAMSQRGNNPVKPEYVPKIIKLLRNIRSDMPFSIMIAKKDEYDADVNQWGAVSVNINGEYLGLKPDEFEVIEWCKNKKL